MYRIVHYLNQFFGGRGGEGLGDLPPTWVDGPVGPGTLLVAALAPQAAVAGTVICGDNYINERETEAVEAILGHIRTAGAHALVAGPAFGAGRYGVACALVCRACRTRLEIPAVTAMHEENPGVDVAAPGLVVATPDSALGMREALATMSRLVLKLCAGEALGPAAEEGYLPTGIKRNVRASRTGAERAVEMLLNKIAGAPYHTEIPLPRADAVPPAPPLDDPGKETLAVVTTGGIVPRGNPDRLESRRATRWLRYSIAGLADLSPEEFECIHGGFDGTEANADPDRVVPVDALRALEATREIGRVHDWLYITTGNAAPLDRARTFGRELADELRRQRIRAVVFTAT